MPHLLASKRRPADSSDLKMLIVTRRRSLTVLVTVGSLYSIIFPKTALPPIVLMGERFLETGFLYTPFEKS